MDIEKVGVASMSFSTLASLKFGFSCRCALMQNNLGKGYHDKVQQFVNIDGA